MAKLDKTGTVKKTITHFIHEHQCQNPKKKKKLANRI